MQLSMTRAHPGFDPEADLLSIKIRLNGVVVTNAIACDTDAGTVITLGPLNNPLGGPPQEITHSGKVEILDFMTDRVLYATPDKE